MVSGDAPAKAENVFSNIFLFKKWVSVWRNARMAGGKAKGGGTGMGTRCRACMAGGSGPPVPGEGGALLPGTGLLKAPSLIYWFFFLTGGKIKGSAAQPACKRGFQGNL